MASKASPLWSAVLSVLCLAAAGAIALQWLNPPQIEPLSVQPVAGPPEIEPFKGVAIGPLSQYGEIIERPLFLAERRPVVETPEAPTAPEPSKEEQQLTLLGVVLMPQATVALVQDDKTGKVNRLRVGEQINGWRVQTVEANRVSLTSGSAVLDLPLERNKKKPPGKHPQAPGKRLPMPGGGIPPAMPSQAAGVPPMPSPLPGPPGAPPPMVIPPMPSPQPAPPGVSSQPAPPGAYQVPSARP